MAIAILCLTTAGLGACGQKGPLYLPAPGAATAEQPAGTPTRATQPR